MAKRRYKLQEFVAHSGNVNCLNFGKKNSRIFITGGDDRKVNLWSVGKPTALMSFYGHTSPVKSAAFDSEEVSVVAGASSGAIKLWDLEGRKTVRTLIGHKSNCTAVQFHPFGEFFSSGSMDTNLKIWDIRKKGCIHTYKGHTHGISALRFSPDGHWLASGGYDNVVKLWDLTAGKLLHSLNFHKGHIRSVQFHPLEFLLATGSADKTVKFWDLETFEMLGSSRREATGVQSITFHPDGRTLFCGLDDKLKVYSWEPVTCHDSLDMEWSKLGDVCIHDEKLLGGSYYENSVAVWVADISLIKPHVTRLGPELHSHSDQKSDSPKSPLASEDSDSIKTIYVDSSSLNSTASETVDSIDAPTNMPPYDSNGISAEWNSAESMQTNGIVLCDGGDGSTGESIASSYSSIGASAEPSHTKRTNLEYIPFGVAGNPKASSMWEKSSIKTVLEMFNTTSSPKTKSRRGSIQRTLSCNKRVTSIKASVAHGRTRSLVEMFERRESFDVGEICSRDGDSVQTPLAKKQKMMTRKERTVLDNSITQKVIEELNVADNFKNLVEEPIVDDNFTNLREEPIVDNDCIIRELMHNHDVLLDTFWSRLTKLQMVRKFWETNDVNGVINLMRKFPDYSVQADVIGVLIERMEVFTLELFSFLLPVLIGLLKSNIERHVSISLEMLLKLVAAYGALILSTVSAPPPIGVDLHAQERIQCSKTCFAYLQNIKRILPQLAKRGGMVARRAQEVNLLLQQL